MATLTAHLLEGDDHGRLGFHPRCPVCRQVRLFGELPAEPVVTRRTQAAVATGVLALAAVGPAVAVAQEGDDQREGVVAPVDPGAVQPESPGFDPGGETALPYEAPPAANPPVAPPANLDGDGSEPQDAVPLESEPVDDRDAALVPSMEPELQPPSTAPDVGVPPVKPAPPPPAPEQPGAPPVVAPRAPADGETKLPPPISAPTPPLQHDDPIRADGDHGSKARKHTAAPPAPSPAARYEAVPTTTAVPEAQPVATAQAVAPTEESAPPLGGDDGRHVVRPGDSLWSIAKRMLGPGASTARVAREVAHLWNLNADRIGTGNPDLLLVGTKLRLR